MFLLYHRASRPTGTLLAQALELPHGDQCVGDRQDVLIRWGSRQGVDYRPVQTINKRTAITLASNKLDSLIRFRELGFSVPQFSIELERVTLPALGRAYQHSRGSDIVLYMNNSDLQFTPDSDYYISYIPTTAEYRVVSYKDKVVRVLLKELENSTIYSNIVERPAPWMRNHGNGYVFRGVTQRMRGSMVEQMGVAAVRALGLDFGAVDLIVGEDNHTYILEVNTAPSCSPTTLKFLAEAIAEDLDIEVNYDFIDSLREDLLDD